MKNQFIGRAFLTAIISSLAVFTSMDVSAKKNNNIGKIIKKSNRQLNDVTGGRSNQALSVVTSTATNTATNTVENYVETANELGVDPIMYKTFMDQLNELPKVAGMRIDEFFKYIKNPASSLEQMIGPDVINLLNSATVEGGILNDIAKDQHRVWLSLYPDGKTPSMVPAFKYPSNVIDEPASSAGNSHDKVRFQLSAAAPLQVQTIAYSGQNPFYIPPWTGQVRVGFPMAMHSQTFGEDHVKTKESNWNLAQNGGYFYTTIALETGPRTPDTKKIGDTTYILRDKDKGFMVPSVALEANLLLKCSTRKAGECQIQNISLQFNLDSALSLYPALKRFHDWWKTQVPYNSQVYKGLFTEVVEISGLIGEAEPKAELGLIEMMDTKPVSGFVPEVEKAFENATPVVGQITNTVNSVTEINTPYGNFNAEDAHQFSEDVDDVAGANSMSTSSTRSQTIGELVAAAGKNCGEKKSTKGTGCFYDRQLVEFQIGATWLNPDVYPKAGKAPVFNTRFKVDNNGSPDLIKFGVLVAAQAGAEISTVDPSDLAKWGMQFRVRMFPNGSYMLIKPLTSVAKEGIPYYTN